MLVSYFDIRVTICGRYLLSVRGEIVVLTVYFTRLRLEGMELASCIKNHDTQPRTLYGKRVLLKFTVEGKNRVRKCIFSSTALYNVGILP